ncbi:hypothetical protein J4573_24995 [Actinomadura barringtoniae]|uniref:Uncharacterized protein n=1 Tax=Actinomadura barringtoniae TaxID=1427535 RepID=A0A939T5A0_9ACTN|nr:hypothetical protein [Actinomadura barringtoniae]MBO2450383.1 hypothetical protein [Actinomadura barringtoniae]
MTARTPELSGPQGSRQTRRRLSLQASPSGGGSPWAKSHEAWRRSGVAWENAGDDAAAPLDLDPVTRTRTRPTVHLIAEPDPTPAPAPRKRARSAAGKTPAKTSAAPEQTAAAPGKARPARSAPRVRVPVVLKVPSGRAVLALGVGGVLVVGFAVYAVTGDEDEGRAAATPGALPAGAIFAVDPAASTDGLTQQLTTVAAAGGTVVAAGAEAAADGGARRARAEFLWSGDRGQTWRLGRVRAADGSEPAPGERPRLLAGGPGAWVAIGAGTSETPVWTSTDAKTWTRQAPGTGAAFGPTDRVASVTRTATGFVAVGSTSPSGRFTGDGRGVVWTSADGRGWQRADHLSDATIAGLDRVAASGNLVVAHGSFRKTVTKTVERKGKKRTTDQTVRGDAIWRSADGGRTWTWVNVPQGQGSYGPIKGVVAGPGGFFLAREGRRTTGSKKHRRTERYGVVLGSADGSSWSPYGQVGAPQYTGVAAIGGSPAGLAVLVSGKDDQNAVLRSAEGRMWQPSAESGGKGTVASGLTVVDGGAPVLAGRRGENAYLSLLGQPVDLTKVPDFVRPERTVTALAPGAGGRTVAVGSTNGDAVAWTGGGTAWTRAQGPSLGPGRLGDVAYGSQGWLAVGDTGVKNGGKALVATSADGSSWQKAPVPGDGAPVASTAGTGGYVAVGRDGDSAAVWQSPDLRRWIRGGNAGRGDLDGGAWMNDVTALTGTGKGFVAVGGRKAGEGRVRPAAWTSPDGVRWTAAAQPPVPPGMSAGGFDQVAARGGLLVATGSGGAPFVGVSADGGRTWRAAVPTGAPQATVLTGVVATAKSFLVAGVAGAPGRQDVALWTSQDGIAWRQAPVRGGGLDGPGDQRLTALAATGNDVTAAGLTADYRGETPTLWRTTAP